MNKYLITGINGFVGYYFLKHLEMQEESFKALGLDLQQNTHLDTSKNFQYKCLNLHDKAELYNIIRDFQPTHIIHLASLSSVAHSWENPALYFSNNTNIFLNLIETLRELKLNSRVLSIGSSEIYASNNDKNIKFNEDYNINASNPYAISRLSQDMLADLYCNHFNADIIKAIAFNHIGARQKDIFFVPSIIKQLIAIKEKKQDKLITGNLDIIRDFSDVRDVVSAYYLLLHKGKKAEKYNVCSSIGTSLHSVVSIVSNMLNITPIIETDANKIRKNDNLVIIGDNSKICNQLNWQRKFSIEQSLHDIIEYYYKA